MHSSPPAGLTATTRAIDDDDMTRRHKKRPAPFQSAARRPAARDIATSSVCDFGAGPNKTTVCRLAPAEMKQATDDKRRRYMGIGQRAIHSQNAG